MFPPNLLGALAHNNSATLYSLSPITTYGHENLFLERKWQLMGALEGERNAFVRVDRRVFVRHDPGAPLAEKKRTLKQYALWT